MSKIEWTDTTWNPVRGCSPVSPGCKNCYAERMAARNLPGMKSPTTGEPFAIMTDHGPKWTGKVELIESKLSEPLRWTKPRRAFVNSMSDLFHEDLSYDDVALVFAVMAYCPHITFQVLTKRADRLRQYCEWAASDPDAYVYAWLNDMNLDAAELERLPNVNPVWPLPNVHLGVSVENQKTADHRIPELLRTPAAVRFVSYEPALEAVDFRAYIPRRMDISEIPGSALNDGCTEMWTVGLDWIIIGGESGPKARPFNLKWARDTIRQCKEAGVPVFLKQLGSEPKGETADLPYLVAMKDKKGGTVSEWPPDLRNGTREFPDKLDRAGLGKRDAGSSAAR